MVAKGRWRQGTVRSGLTPDQSEASCTDELERIKNQSLLELWVRWIQNEVRRIEQSTESRIVDIDVEIVDFLTSLFLSLPPSLLLSFIFYYFFHVEMLLVFFVIHQQELKLVLKNIQREICEQVTKNKTTKNKSYSYKSRNKSYSFRKQFERYRGSVFGTIFFRNKESFRNDSSILKSRLGEAVPCDFNGHFADIWQLFALSGCNFIGPTRVTNSKFGDQS